VTDVQQHHDPLEAALKFDTHFEWPLDDEPEPTRAPVYVDVTVRDDERRPIIPAAYRRGNVRTTVRRGVGRNSHRAGYHVVRAPLYATKVAWYSTVGSVRILGKSIRWWWVLEQHQLRQEAATSNDPQTWMKLHAEARDTRRWRGIVLLGAGVGIVLLTAALWWLDRWWAWAAVGIPTAVLLAHHGRPIDKPILGTAVVVPRFRMLTSDIVLRAYYAAKLGDPDKAPVDFGGTMARDGEGSQVVVNLPYGKSFGDAIKAKAAIASGLDVAESQVFLTRDPASTRSHVLWVADRDPLAIPAGRTPLLRLRPTDIWAPAPFGLDQRGRPVSVELMWNSLLVGAQPRKGKTFAARLLALYAALDPYVRITIIDGKKSPDWTKFGLVADRYIRGTTPMFDSGDQIDLLIDTLEEIKQDIGRRNDRLTQLPPSICPEGKLTREIARNPSYGMPVRLVVLEEFQVYYELPEQDTNKQIANLLTYLASVGPSAGVIILSSTQKPSGVGSGDVARLFTRYRDNHQIRFALRCGNRVVSEAVLGGEAYNEGFDASGLPLGEAYRGVGILYGDRDEPPTVRTHLADGVDAERILVAARSMRERAGTLTGMAAGESAEVTRRDPLADVRTVFYAGEAAVSWKQIAERLADSLPEAYAGTTQEAVSATVRPLLDEESRSRKGLNVAVGDQRLKGLSRTDLEEAIARRQIGDGR
jgi:DNA segregation ATPase FtsK/SpoIIIE, S-DNA-T family